MHKKSFIHLFFLLLMCFVNYTSTHASPTPSIDDGNNHTSLKSKIEVTKANDHKSLPDSENLFNKTYEISGFVYFDQSPASAELQKLWHWILETDDNLNAPFLIIDKAHAQLLIFDNNGQLVGTTPVLLGLAYGDKLALDTSQLPLAQVKPEERITPAGRFSLESGHDLQGNDIFWVDYDTSISLHRTFEGNVKERRRERLLTHTSSDNRISYGCINVPKEFYEKILRPTFRSTAGVAYIMPEDNIFAFPFK